MIASCLQYHQLCEVLGKRFPFGAFEKPSGFTAMFAEKKKVPVVMVDFAWWDAYHRSKRMVGHTLLFEKSCVLFNVGTPVTGINGLIIAKIRYCESTLFLLFVT